MEDITGRFGRLPDGQRVIVEEVEEGLATVRRVDGEWKDQIAVCAVSKLELYVADSEVE
jgi:hypothetical protein